jgi:PIN domain nuclease of toxin-antitoxin system
MIVLDTSVLLYWTLDPGKLSAKAEKAIRKSEEIRISSISIWEIGIKVKKGNLVIPLSLQKYVDRVKHAEGLEIVSVTEEIWMKNVKLRWEHKDPADRTIVATARLLQSPLVTSDETIRRFYKRSVW